MPYVWNQWLYSPGDMDDDGRLPTPRTPHWKQRNVVRCAVDDGPDHAAGSDLVAEVLDVCTHECAQDRLVASVRAGNRGTTEVPWPVVLTLSGLVGGERVDLGTVSWEGLPAATWADSQQIVVDRPDVAGLTDLRAQATPDGWTIRQCDNTNDTADWSGATCSR
jgi:hypothetical protein